jgi:hypothetical protein
LSPATNGTVIRHLLCSSDNVIESSLRELRSAGFHAVVVKALPSRERISISPLKGLRAGAFGGAFLGLMLGAFILRGARLMPGSVLMFIAGSIMAMLAGAITGGPLGIFLASPLTSREDLSIASTGSTLEVLVSVACDDPDSATLVRDILSRAGGEERPCVGLSHAPGTREVVAS